MDWNALEDLFLQLVPVETVLEIITSSDDVFKWFLDISSRREIFDRIVQPRNRLVVRYERRMGTTDVRFTTDEIFRLAVKTFGRSDTQRSLRLFQIVIEAISDSYKNRALRLALLEACKMITVDEQVLNIPAAETGVANALLSILEKM